MDSDQIKCSISSRQIYNVCANKAGLSAVLSAHNRHYIASILSLSCMWDNKSLTYVCREDKVDGYGGIVGLRCMMERHLTVTVVFMVDFDFGDIVV